MTIEVVNQRQKSFFEKLIALCNEYDVAIIQGEDGKGWKQHPAVTYEFNWNETFGDECNTPDVNCSSVGMFDQQIFLKGQ